MGGALGSLFGGRFKTSFSLGSTAGDYILVNSLNTTAKQISINVNFLGNTIGAGTSSGTTSYLENSNK